MTEVAVETIGRVAEVLSREGFATRVAWCGGEGARRFYTAMVAREIAECGGVGVGTSEAARAALGAAAAGERVVLTGSGFEGAAVIVPVLWEMIRAGVSAMVVIPSHGAESGGVLPESDGLDVRVLEAVGIPVELLSPVGCAEDLERVERECVMHWQRAQRDARPSVVAFSFRVNVAK